MVNRIRKSVPRGLNQGRGSKFRVGSRIRQTPEEGQSIYRPKRCEYNNKDEDNSPKTMNDNNPPASSQIQTTRMYFPLASISDVFIQSLHHEKDVTQVPY